MQGVGRRADPGAGHALALRGGEKVPERRGRLKVGWEAGRSSIQRCWENIKYAKIRTMNAKLPQPVHESYRRHRKQVGWQIILPVLLSAVLCVALIVLINVATFRDGGDVARWAAVSTIWIVIPIMIGLVILFALLAGLVYLMARLLNIAPHYTNLAQDYVHKAAGYVRRGADATVRPVFFAGGLGASIKAFFGRK